MMIGRNSDKQRLPQRVRWSIKAGALNEMKLGHGSRMLIDTTQNIDEVAYKSGFNNMSNFNRIFKKKKDCTPKEFGRAYTSLGVRTFI